MAYGSSNPRAFWCVVVAVAAGCGAPVKECQYDRDCPSTSVCARGVCVFEVFDAGHPNPSADAGAPRQPDDAGEPDAGALDAGAEDAGLRDAGASDPCDPRTASCDCHPQTCAQLGATCGVNVPDGCGGVIASCGLGSTCTGAQMVCNASNNHCECQPKTCAELGAMCGVNVPDGCGGTIAQCGVGANCGTFSHCGQTLVCECNSTVDAPDDAFQDTNCDGLDGNERDAIFVSTLGTDAAAGTTRSQAVATLDRALVLVATTQRHFIFIAAGTYAAPLRAWADGVSLIGGYDSTWARSNSNRAVLTAPSSGWVVAGLTSPIVIERLVVISTDAGGTSAPSIGLRLLNTGSAVALRFVDVNAGRGSDGAPGLNGTAGARGADGFNGRDSVSGHPERCNGGASGGLPNGLNGGVGGCNALPNGGAALGGAPGGVVGCPATNGASGTAGAMGAAGTSGAWGSGFGGFAADGSWFAGPAMAGGSGSAGRVGLGGDGGGGGGKQDCGLFGPWEAGGEGGGGGGGGNGGSGGTGGTGGGASVAMVVINSNPMFTSVALSTRGAGNGGVGGAGGAGGFGGVGGFGGFGVANGSGASGNGGRGGTGGRGGPGGPGGSGQGGPSLGLVCSGVTTSLNPQVSLGPSGTNTFSAGLYQAKLNCP